MGTTGTVMPYFDKDGNEVSLAADSEGVGDLISAAVKEATSGLAANKDEILSEKKALQAKMDALAKQWDGLDPETVRKIMSRLETDEETKLLAEGKLDEVLARRTERLRADHAEQVSALDERIKKLTGEHERAQSEVKRLRVEGDLRQAATELNVVATAIPDALARAMAVFTVVDDGSLSAEKDGATWYGKDGKTPISPREWLEAMKESAPHWFPGPSGVGAAGGARSGDSLTITREDARDVVKYRAAKEAAEKAGTALQIVA